MFLKIKEFFIYLVVTLCFFKSCKSNYGEYQIYNYPELVTTVTLNTLADMLHLEKTNPRDLVTFWCVSPVNQVYQQVHHYDLDVQVKLDFSKPFGIFIHGWTDNAKRSWLIQMVHDYARYLNSNMCAVDWGRLAATEYSIAVKNSRHVANFLIEFLSFLIKNGLRLSDTTLIGHSAGGQISGMVGMYFNGEIGRIIGLDATGVLYGLNGISDKLHVRKLGKKDAQFVQCINTDYEGLGSHYNCGHQNFYPNNGRNVQPGCDKQYYPESSSLLITSMLCSHYKAVEYFHYSLNPAVKFIGTECDSYDNWFSGKCSGNPTTIMGVYAKQEDARGTLYLQTTDTPPFATNISEPILLIIETEIV